MKAPTLSDTATIVALILTAVVVCGLVCLAVWCILVPPADLTVYALVIIVPALAMITRGLISLLEGGNPRTRGRS